MKNIFFFIIALATVATITVSCNQSSNKNSDQQANDSTGVSENQNLSSTQNAKDSATVPIDTTAKKLSHRELRNRHKISLLHPLSRIIWLLRTHLLQITTKQQPVQASSCSAH